MATHPSTLAWRIPWAEEPGRLQSTGSQRVGHNRSDLVHEIITAQRLCDAGLELCQMHSKALVVVFIELLECSEYEVLRLHCL